MAKSVDQCVRRTGALYDRIALQLSNVLLDGSPRGRLVNSTSMTAVEHGLAIRLLMSAEQFASAAALLRVQFEAVVRAIWLHSTTPDVSMPEDTPNVQEMLDAIDHDAPPQVGTMLRDLKQATCGQKNSYVSYSADHALAMLRNANGLTAIASMQIAMLSGDQRVSNGMRQIQMDHLDCLPPHTSAMSDGALPAVK